jgi:hypothetical protein
LAGQIINALYSPRDIRLGIESEKGRRIQFRLTPPLHPEELLANIVIDQVRADKPRPLRQHP